MKVPVCLFMILVFLLHSFLMIFNTIFIATLSLYKSNDILLKFLSIHYSLNDMTFLSSFETKEYLLPHLMLKEEAGGRGFQILASD